MVGNGVGGAKNAARWHGLTLAEYESKVRSDISWCRVCESWKPGASFNRDSSRTSGRATACIGCRASRKNGRPSTEEASNAACLGIRWCGGCASWKSKADFTRNKCKACQRAAAKRWYEARGRASVTARVRARKLHHKPPPEWWVRETILATEGLCVYDCGRPAIGLDHIVPVSKGGLTAPWNLVPCCRSCNSSKRGRDLNEWLGAVGRGLSEASQERLLATQGLEYESLLVLDGRTWVEVPQ